MRWGGLGVEVISTGDELLFGRVIDTNSSWIARKTSELGGRVNRFTCIGDEIADIISVLREALARGNDLIIFTGGLGPSEDDLTVEAIGQAVSREVVLDLKTVEKIRKSYEERGITLTARGKKMARMLKGSEPIPNDVGMATGMILREDGTTIITLPGVPSEMKAMFDKHVAPMIEERSSSKFLAETVNVRIVWKDFFPIYRQMQKDYPEVYIKNKATPPEAPEERKKIKEIKVDIVVEAAAKEEGEKKINAFMKDFENRIEAFDGELIML